MHEMEQLKRAIEEARKELDASIFVEDFAVYYEKSRKLDKLIEQYLEVSSNCNT